MLRTRDGVNIAWASTGDGPPFVRASTWLTHLEHDWESPVWRHWIEFFAEHFELIRYDERGSGMSDWVVDDYSWTHWPEDLEEVIDAAGIDTPFAILGVSQGGVAAISYAVRYPERVSHLVLCGAYSRGWGERNDSEGAQQYRAILELTRLGWGQQNPVYRQLFTSRFVPEGTPEQFDWFNELCRKSTKPEVAYELLKARMSPNVGDLLPKVKVPTLVLHATHDEVVPLSEGRFLATEIPNARFVQLESRNHILLEDEPAWQRFKDEVTQFLGISPSAGEEDPVFKVLTPREREILVHIAEGETNAAIGEALFISEKTVRNNITRIFEKLGVSSRAQAIVLAKDKRLGNG
jgi:pimeloyl-ACP methyl ester carboxylesterase/DNA-binding CsgD family transcriptional regulator